jgi:hypothetical protein
MQTKSSDESRKGIKQLKDALWWGKTIGQGLAITAVTFAPEILRIFPEHTMVFKLAVPIGFMIKFLWMRKDYKKDVLPSGITKVMDKIPDAVTGEKGSDNLFNAGK